MTKDEFKQLGEGDIIINKYSEEGAYVVTSKYGGRVTVVRSEEIIDPGEWELIAKSETYPKDIDQDALKNHKCHGCGKIATIYSNSPYLAELHPEDENPEMWWCEDCLQENADNI